MSRYLFLLLLAISPASAQSALDELPKKVVPDAPMLDNTPLDPEILEKSIRRGVDYLIQSQNPDGSWGGATQTKGLNIYAPLPGSHHAMRLGSSSLALIGIIDSNDQRAEVLSAIDKASNYLLTALPKLRRADSTTTYNNWGHAYGLRALCALARRPNTPKAKHNAYRQLAQQQVNALLRYQDVDGGWGYLHFKSVTDRPSGGSTCFTTATVLLALHDAKTTFGITPPDSAINKALKSIWMQRNPDFSYVYAMNHKWRPRFPINRPAGSLARTPACNAATRIWGDTKITDPVLETGLDRLVKRNGWLDIGRKRPIPHETHFAISGYFYYYGHFYASECINLLPETSRSQWQHKIAKILITKQEIDGAWWDYPLYSYHKPYGTGYTLSTLSRCRSKSAQIQ